MSLNPAIEEYIRTALNKSSHPYVFHVSKDGEKNCTTIRAVEKNLKRTNSDNKVTTPLIKSTTEFITSQSFSSRASKRKIWGTRQPQQLEECGHLLDGTPIACADGQNTKDYKEDKSWQSTSHNHICWICQNPINNTKCFLSTACDCKAPLHAHCLATHTDHGIRAVKDSTGGELPDFFPKCGLCMAPFLGQFKQQFDAACIEFRKFSAYTLEVRQKIWATKLPPVIFALEQVIKSIWNDWRATGVGNSILAGALAMLSTCLGTLYAFAHDTSTECCRLLERAMYTYMLAYAECDSSFFLGVDGVSFVLQVADGESQVGHLHTAQNVFPALATYLLKLMADTMEDDVGSVRLQHVPTQLQQEETTRIHKLAQQYYLQMLNNGTVHDEQLRTTLQNMLHNFMLTNASLRFSMAENQQVMSSSSTTCSNGTVKQILVQPLFWMTDEMCQYVHNWCETFNSSARKCLEKCAETMTLIKK